MVSISWGGPVLEPSSVPWAAPPNPGSRAWHPSYRPREEVGAQGRHISDHRQ